MRREGQDMALTDGAELVAAINQSLHQHWRTYLIEGIILLVLGVAAIVVPLVAGLGITIILGWLFLTGGLVGMVATFGARQIPGFWWSLEQSSRWEWMIIGGVIDLVLAALILSGLPGAFAWALGLLVGIDLIFAGSSLIAMALAARQALPSF
jgi:uncharacterized membrane protein HdeD (DUF308 family)